MDRLTTTLDMLFLIMSYERKVQRDRERGVRGKEAGLFGLVDIQREGKAHTRNNTTPSHLSLFIGLVYRVIEVTCMYAMHACMLVSCLHSSSYMDNKVTGFWT